MSLLPPLAFIAEVIIVIIADGNVAAIIGAHKSAVQDWEFGDFGWGHYLSSAGWYYAPVSQLIFWFLVGLSLWKWFLWICFLFRLSRLNLELVPTHPDQHGGIGFLGMSPLAIAPTVFVACGAIGSTWRSQILDHGAHLRSFKIDAIVLLLIMLIISMGGPLVFSLQSFGVFIVKAFCNTEPSVSFTVSIFIKKWILNRAGHEEEFLTAPEISTLTDYAGSYENVEKLQPFPLDRGAMVALVLAVALPLLPVVLAEIPFIAVVKGLLAAAK